MTELEKITHAKIYVDKLANGINPLTGQQLPDSDIVNNVKISRCLFYVSAILRQVIEREGDSPRKAKIVKKPFQLDYEARKIFEYSEVPIPISEITRRINALIRPDEMNKLNYKHIADWLIQANFLTAVTRDDGKVVRRPTNNGMQLGITTEQRQSPRGIYTVVVYNKEAQQFILDNLDAVIEVSQR